MLVVGEIKKMILKPFEYSSPHSLQEACKILEQHDDAKILAGGQSLLPIMKLNLTEITHLVDIKKSQSIFHRNQQ